jgi:hypothetical protein
MRNGAMLAGALLAGGAAFADVTGESYPRFRGPVVLRPDGSIELGGRQVPRDRRDAALRRAARDLLRLPAGRHELEIAVRPGACPADARSLISRLFGEIASPEDLSLTSYSYDWAGEVITVRCRYGRSERWSRFDLTLRGPSWFIDLFVLSEADEAGY